ncbi:MAG: NAD-dependent epimerase/dehydratase family protein [Solirubrobacteraceae bacterium]
MGSFLVTGAAGFIGSNLCVELQRQGHWVRGVDAFTDYYARPLKEANLEWARGGGRLEVVETDLSDADLETLFDGMDGVFHLAAQPGVRASWGRELEIYLRDNVFVSHRVFQAAAARSIRVVYASSSSIYGDAESYPTHEQIEPRPISPYGITKLACEHLARSFAKAEGLDAVGLRYFTVFGPGQRPDMAFTRLIATAIDAGTFELFGDGDQSRDFTYVSDAVAATIGSMERGTTGAVYNVGGGAETTVNEVIGMLEDLIGLPLVVQRGARVAGDVRRTASDTARISNDLGWKPQHTLRNGLADQVEWMRTSHRVPDHA